MNALDGFLPDVVLGDGRIRLVEVGPPPFPDAFLTTTVARSLEEGGASTALGVERLLPGTPQGVIVHLGRCGSTLLARLLDASGAASFREPDALHPGGSGDHPGGGTVPSAVAGHLAAMAAAVGRPAVIKLASTGHGLVAGGGPLTAAPLVGVVRAAAEVVPRVLDRPPWWAIERFTSIGAASVDEGGVIIVDGMAAVDALCDAWVAGAEAILDAGDGALVVSFDRLVRDPAGVVRSVGDHQGWQPEIRPERIRSVMATDAKLGTPMAPSPARRNLPDGAAARIAARTARLWQVLERRAGSGGA